MTNFLEIVKELENAYKNFTNEKIYLDLLKTVKNSMCNKKPSQKNTEWDSIQKYCQVQLQLLFNITKYIHMHMLNTQNLLPELQIEGLRSKNLPHPFSLSPPTPPPPQLPENYNKHGLHRVKKSKRQQQKYMCSSIHGIFMQPSLLAIFLVCFFVFPHKWLEMITILAKLKYFSTPQERPDGFRGKILSHHFEKHFCQDIVTHM